MKENKPLVLNLNTYSHYSLLNSTLSIDKIIDFAISQGQKYVALSDNNMYGAMDFYLKCIKKNLKPLIGLHVLYQKFNFIAYAKNFKGYQNLLKISSAIMCEDENFDVLKHLDNTFIIDFENNVKVDGVNIYQTSEIAFNTAHYHLPQETKIFNALKMIKDNKVCNDEEVLNFDNNSHLLDLDTFVKRFSEKQIIALNQEIINVDLQIVFEKNNIIEYKNQEKISSKAFLKKLCESGLNNKILENEIDQKRKQEYEDRLNEELTVIDSMGFNDYFLVVQDFVNEAKNKGILVGPGRGSAAGSLVSFLLSITAVDPIKYNLLFERFLNPGRVSMPDIDIDIMDTRRQEVVDYIFSKYGYDHIAHIVTFQRIKAKMAIRDVGRILAIDLKEINRICKLIPNEYDENLIGAIESVNELKAYKKDYQTLFEISSAIIGCPRQTGIHAAGIVLSKKPLNEIIPIQRSVNKEITTQFSMEYLEDLGLIKMDLLGLTNLTTIYNVIKLINMIHQVDFALDKINLEDKAVFLDAQKGNTLGIFQLESPGMTATVKKVKPNSIEDISICSALFRPGPMQNIKSLVDRRNNVEPIEYIDEKNKDILKDTYGIIVYQEQVINLVKNIANFSPYEADMFRRLISKKKGDELEKFKDKFFASAEKNGYQKEELEKIYSYIYTFADYGFNHSHSFAYSLISYWLLYLKHYYPIEFMTVLMMSSEGNTTKVPVYLKECERLNIKVLKPNILISDKNLSLYKRCILFGLCAIKGIGQETAKKIVNIRNQFKFEDFLTTTASLMNNGIGISTIETLIYAGTFDVFNLNRKTMLASLQDISQASGFGNDKQMLEKLVSLNKLECNVKEQETFLEKEKTLVGIVFEDEQKKSLNDLETLNKYKKFNVKPINEIKDIDVFFDSIITIKSFNIKKTKRNTNMLFLKIIDVFNNAIEVCSFTKEIIEKINDFDLTKKYLATFKTSSFRLTLLKIKQEVE